jgi:hypothetical protein
MTGNLSDYTTSELEAEVADRKASVEQAKAWPDGLKVHCQGTTRVWTIEGREELPRRGMCLRLRSYQGTITYVLPKELSRANVISNERKVGAAS